MKYTLRRVATALGLAMTLGLATQAQANLLLNGGFESGANVIGGPICSDTITNWAVTNLGTCGGIDWVPTSTWTPQEGTHSIDLNSFDTGAISQSFATQAGHVYAVSFYLAGNPGGVPTTKQLDVLIDGVDRVAGPDFQFSTVGKSQTNMGWTLETFNFTADDGTTTLQFKSLVSGASGPALDNVSVVEVIPEPASLALLGLGLLGLGFSRRKKA